MFDIKIDFQFIRKIKRCTLQYLRIVQLFIKIEVQEP
jgi:hypothetical protein